MNLMIALHIEIRKSVYLTTSWNSACYIQSNDVVKE